QTTIDSVIVNTDPGASRIAASGTGIPGVEVQLVLDSTAVSTTTIGESGNWSLIATLDQPDAYAVAVRSIDPATGAVTDVPVPAQRMIIALPTPTSTATATPEIDATATPTPVPTAPFAVTGYEFDNESGVVALQGSGAPAGLVRLLLDSTSVATSTIDLDGRWALSTTLDAAGDYALQVENLTAQGEVIARSPALAVTLRATPEPSATSTPTQTPSPTTTPTSSPSPSATASPTPEPTAPPDESATVAAASVQATQ